MKLCTIISFTLAILIRLFWRSGWDLAYRVDALHHRTVAPAKVLFWILLLIGATALFLSLRKKFA
jgi:hypothetical protein